jgi:hypothetical protein
MAHLQAVAGRGWRDGLQLWRVAANTMIEQPRTNNISMNLRLGCIIWINDLRDGIWMCDSGYGT